MSDFWKRTKTRLAKKLGPLPLWVWLAVGGVLLIVYLRRRRTTGASTATTTAAAPASSDSSAVPVDTSGSGGGYGGYSGGGGGYDTGAPQTQPAPVATAPSTLTGGGPDGQSNPPPPGPAPPGATASRTSPQWKQIATSRTGAKIFETQGGSIVEQAPGRSPYTIAKAGSSAARSILSRLTGPGKPLEQTKPRAKAHKTVARHTAHHPVHRKRQPRHRTRHS